MERKNFIKKSLLGTGMLISSKLLSGVIDNDIDELKALEPIGFNHLPNPKTTLMENTVLHKADSRGKADHGWLKANFSFSFANYYNPERMHFGVLRVMNDDIISAGQGFGTHPHDNMEIITIPLQGALEHKDSMGNGTIIHYGDIQCMSAGSGIQHSEFNPNKDKAANTLQIWMFPNKKNVTPRYDQLTLAQEKKRNNLLQILSPNTDDDGVWVHQNAWFHMGIFDQHFKTKYTVKSAENGVYVFVIQGDVKIENQILNPRDGMGLWNTQAISIEALSPNTELLIMDVPMSN